MPINSIAPVPSYAPGASRVSPVAAATRPQDVRNLRGERASTRAPAATVDLPLIGVAREELQELAQMLGGRALTESELATLIRGDFGRTPMGEAMASRLARDALRNGGTSHMTQSERHTWEAVVEDAIRLPLRSWYALHERPSPALVQPGPLPALQLLFQLLHQGELQHASWADVFPARQAVSMRVKALERVARDATLEPSDRHQNGSGSPWIAAAVALLTLGAMPGAHAEGGVGEAGPDAGEAGSVQVRLLEDHLVNVAAPAAGCLARLGATIARYPRAMAATLGGAALMATATALRARLGSSRNDEAHVQSIRFAPLAGLLAPDVLDRVADQVQQGDASLPADERALQAVRALGSAADGARTLWAVATHGRSDRVQLAPSGLDIEFGGWLIKQVLGEPVPAGGVDMTWSDWTLPNGLRVILAPGKGDQVGVQLRFGDGSAIEREGQFGAVHLAEHLWFRRNLADAPPFDDLYAAAGVRDNAYTTHDATVYHTEGPLDTLPLVLLEKSYRLARAADPLPPAHFETERNVVLNELRQRDTRDHRAGGVLARAMYPQGHPYRIHVGGRPGDLRALQASDMENFMRIRQRPNLATLVISGNADEDDVRRMVADYFGNIEPGNTFPRRAPDIHRRVTDTNEEMFDNVSTPRLYRAWNVPQDGHVDLPALTLAAHVINRRLDAALENQVAFAAAYVDPCELGSQFRILLDLRGDTDQQHVEETLNGVVATFIEQGPTTDELDGARRVLIAAGAHARASSDAMATAVVHCLDRAAAPDCVNVDVQAWQEATPGLVQDTAAAWLARGSHTLLVTPGERPRPPSEIAGEVRHAPWDPGTPDPSLSATPTRIDRTVLPALAEPGPAYFPAVARTALPNGVPLVLAPMREGRNTRVVFLFDGGRMGDLDPDTGLGVAQAVSRVLTQRAGALEKHALAQELDQLGLAVTARATEGYSTVVLQGPAANLARGLGIVKDMLADTRFPEDLLDQSRARALASIARVTTAPLLRGNVLMEQLVLGEQHPYGRDPLGEGTEATVAAMAPVQLSRWADRYLQPSNVTIVAIGRFQPATLSADLERVFGSVEGAVDRRRPDVPLPTRSAHPGVYVLWADQGSQAQVMLGYTVHRDDATHDILPICIDKIIQRRVKTALREQQGLTYEIYPLRTATRGVRVGGFISAVDRTGGIDALATARTVVADLLEGRAPVTQAELNLHLLGARRELATRFQDPLDVEAALVAAVDIGRDIQIDDVARVMTNLTSDDVNSALGHMSSNHLTWVLAVPSNRGVDESVSSETDDGQAAPAELRLRFTAMGLSHFTTIDPATGARSLHQL